MRFWSGSGFGDIERKLAAEGRLVGCDDAFLVDGGVGR